MPGQPTDRAKLRQFEAIIDVAVSRFAVDCGLRKPYMSLIEAYKAYGRKTVDRWIDEKLVTRLKDGTGYSKCRIKRSEIELIELIAAISNQASWFDHYEQERSRKIQKSYHKPMTVEDYIYP